MYHKLWNNELPSRSREGEAALGGRSGLLTQLDVGAITFRIVSLILTSIYRYEEKPVQEALQRVPVSPRSAPTNRAEKPGI